MARFQIPPQPRSSSRGSEWSHAAWSDAGGRVPRRQVRVRYRYPGPDRPARAGRDGVILLIFTVIGSPILLVLGGWALSGDERTRNDWVGAALAFSFVAWWWYISVAHFVRAIRGAGRRTVRGVVVASLTRTFHHWETGDPWDVHFLGVDDGTSDESYGWDVPHEVYEAVVDGTPVELVVSSDGRCLYMLDTTPID